MHTQLAQINQTRNTLGLPPISTTTIEALYPRNTIAQQVREMDADIRREQDFDTALGDGRR